MPARQRGAEPATLTFDGKTMTISQWAAETGIPAGALWSRLSYGWSVEEIITKPLRKRPGHIETPMPNMADNLRIAKAVEDQVIYRIASRALPMLDEDDAYKRACIRAGYQMAIALIEAEEVTLEQLRDRFYEGAMK